MQSYRLSIEPVSPGSRGGEGLKPGDASYSTTPQGERRITLDMTQAQVVGVQGYLTLIKSGADTSSVESAITALTPT